MSKSKNLYYTISALKEAFDRLEGEHSNIPNCCVEGFISGRTYMNVRNSLSSEKDLKKLDKWGYVPCDKCFKKNNKNKIKLNGRSEIGTIIFSIMEVLQTRRKNGTD